MIKKIGSCISALFLSLFLIASAVCGTAAEEAASLPDADNGVYSLDSDGYYAEEATEQTEADYPLLTVNAISNYFPKAIGEYNSTTRQVIVTYSLLLSEDILNVQWYAAYDSSVLTFSELNTIESICPRIGNRAVIDLSEKDTIQYSASDMRLFEFSKEETTLVQLIFDVAEIDPEDPVTTTIDLTIDVLRVSKANPETGFSDPADEIDLVDNLELKSNTRSASIKTSGRTTLTPSTYSPPSTDGNSSYDEPTEAETEASTAPLTQAASAAETTVGAIPEESPGTPFENGALLSMGELPMALAFLAVMLMGTAIVFIKYKRDIFEG